MSADILTIGPASRIATVFVRVCAWCGERQGFKLGAWNGRCVETTHDIRDACLDARYPDDDEAA